MKPETKMIIGVMILTIAFIGGVAYFSDKSSVEDQVRLSTEPMGEAVPIQTSAHVRRGEAHPEYSTNPPTSGWHWGNATAGPGIKDEPIEDELVIHSMEHGAAVVWYKEGISENELEIIKQAFLEAKGKKIMLPRVDLDVPVALTSWGYIMKLDTVDAETIKQFIEINNDRAPEKAPI